MDPLFLIAAAVGILARLLVVWAPGPQGTGYARDRGPHGQTKRTGARPE